MQNTSNSYSFIPFTSRSLGLVAEWLSTPAVSKWYQDHDYIDDLEDQLENKHINMQLVCLYNAPFAFVLDYDIHSFSDHHLSFLEEGARGIDTFIGKPSMLGLGHAPAYLKLLTDMLCAQGIPALGIDPHPANTQAIKAYEKIGFKTKDETQTKWGPVTRMSLILNE